MTNIEGIFTEVGGWDTELPWEELNQTQGAFDAFHRVWQGAESELPMQSEWIKNQLLENATKVEESLATGLDEQSTSSPEIQLLDNGPNEESVATGSDEQSISSSDKQSQGFFMGKKWLIAGTVLGVSVGAFILKFFFGSKK